MYVFESLMSFFSLSYALIDVLVYELRSQMFQEMLVVFEASLMRVLVNKELL
jgi:hypothetical protein